MIKTNETRTRKIINKKQINKHSNSKAQHTKNNIHTHHTYALTHKTTKKKPKSTTKKYDNNTEILKRQKRFITNHIKHTHTKKQKQG